MVLTSLKLKMCFCLSLYETVFRLKRLRIQVGPMAAKSTNGKKYMLHQCYDYEGGPWP